MTIFLGLVPLTADDKRLQRRLLRVFIYSYELITLVCMFLVGSHWLIALGVSMALLCIVLAWNQAAIKKAVRNGSIVQSPESRSTAMRELSARLPRIAILMALGGAGFAFAGHYNGNIYWASAFCFAISLGLFICWRVLQRP
jgi:hypothetical protein